MGYDMYWEEELSEDEQRELERAEHKASVLSGIIHAEMDRLRQAGKEMRNAFTASGQEELARLRAENPQWIEGDGVFGFKVYGDPELVFLSEVLETIHDEVYAHRKHYFRLNISGMVFVAGALERVGVITATGGPEEWPKPGAFGLEEWPDLMVETEEGSWVKREPTDTEKRFLDRVEEIRAGGDDEVRGIPGWKFSTNDGWLVTPAECEAAWKQWVLTSDADRVAACDGDDGVALVNRFMEWTRDAASRGGFRVW